MKLLSHPSITRPFRAVFYALYFKSPIPSSDYELKNSEAIVAIPFGSHRPGHTIGISNEAMVQIMKSLHERFPEQKIIAQWEMNDSSTQLPYNYLVGKRWAEHINTWEFFKDVRNNFPSLEKITVVAHPDHMMRVTRTAQTLGFKPVIPKEILTIPYDKGGSMAWCEYPWKIQGLGPKKWGFMWWELLVKPYFVMRGWM